MFSGMVFYKINTYFNEMGLQMTERLMLKSGCVVILSISLQFSGLKSQQLDVRLYTGSFINNGAKLNSIFLGE